MWADVVDLRDFYATSLGHLARRMIRRRIRLMWPDAGAQSLLGLGYATPYLGPFRDPGARVIAIMPAARGVLHWPVEGPGLVTLAEETELPLPDLSMDRILLVHTLEYSEQLRPMLREVWRVLAAGGRLLVVAPNRRGLWARLERSPFGHGLPYTTSQLQRLLRDNMFTPVRDSGALYLPPVRSRMLLATAAAWERIGDRWLGRFAGVVLVEASKQLYAPSVERAAPRRRLTPPLTEPFPSPSRTGAGRAEAQLIPRRGTSTHYHEYVPHTIAFPVSSASVPDAPRGREKRP